MSIKYSIISSLIRPEIKEKISIGILVFDGRTTHLRYSTEKLHIAKELLSDNGYKLLRDVLKNIEYKVQIDQPDYWLKKGFPFPENTAIKIFSTEYVGYLSKYSNNSVSFSEPKIIDIESSNDTIKVLFEKYVNKDELDIDKTKKHQRKIFDEISIKYKGRIDKMFDVSKEVTHEIVPNLITPITIDFSGRNGIDVYVQTLDMEQPTNVVSNHINCLFQLKSIYSQNKVKMKDFIIAKEPSKDLIKQHDIWNQIRSYKAIEYVDVSESDKVIEYAESKGVKPLSQITE